jgi:hypothetical protein
LVFARPEAWHRLVRALGIREHHVKVEFFERVGVRLIRLEGYFHHSVGLGVFTSRCGGQGQCHAGYQSYT